MEEPPLVSLKRVRGMAFGYRKMVGPSPGTALENE
jgi:hypothetical protein